ncbi:MAG TPA: S8 family serine peptidase, partial [Chloroflexota bacterium]|nr:S8 family serine peptidase [Chloroflexota bacterium]
EATRGTGKGWGLVQRFPNHPDIQWDNKRYNAYDGTGNVFDSSAWKHGVGVSGVIGAKTNNGLGIAGVCKNCAIIPVKVADEDGSISMASLISAIYWVASQNIKVANISIEASGQCSVTSQPALLLAINNAVSSGVVIVAAAGNGGGFVSDVVPASCPGVISVGAVNQNSELASYSNMGAVLVAPGGGGGFSWPDYTAYGSGIGCPYNDVDSYFQSNTNGNFIAWVSSPASGSVPCYRYLSGTSFAAPHVAGVVAMMRAANSTLSPSAIEFILKITATHLPSCGVSCGAGLLNAGSAVFFAKAVGITP